jgi:immune inhibitor A
MIWTQDFSTAYYQALIGGNGVKYEHLRQDGSPVSEDLTGASLRDYYANMSRGAYQIDADVVGWVKVPHSIWWCGADPCPGRNSRLEGGPYHGGIPGAGSAKTLVQDAITAVKAAYPTLDWSQYDLDRDGVLDHLWIINAGLGEDAYWELLT